MPDDIPVLLRRYAFNEGRLLIDSIACELHNGANGLLGNREESDVRWLARRLFDNTNAGVAVPNSTFETTGLTPSRIWAHGYRYDDLPNDARRAWEHIARLCIQTLPALCERIGHRWRQASEALRVIELGMKAEVGDGAE